MLFQFIMASGFVFFFQAEDGIRDGHVTGVQTCALPILSLAKEADIILDGTDNFDTRMMINDVAFKLNKPWVNAACVEASYSSCGFVPGRTRSEERRVGKECRDGWRR